MTNQSTNRANVGPVQGWTLVACAWLSVMANMVISPVLPTMTEHFSDIPNVDYWISLCATSPALFVAMLAIPAGYLGNRVGHERLLLVAAVVYAVAGVAPVFMNELKAIVLTRAIVGVAEAAIMTCSTALIGDFFYGPSRERYLALQTGTAPVIAIVAVALGGLAGNADWHNAFAIYGFAFVLAIGVTTLRRKPKAGSVSVTTNPATRGEATDSVNWLKLGGICAITVFAMTAFLVTIIQLPFLLTERGVPEPSMIGLLASCATLANPLGALFFTLTRFRLSVKLAIAFGMLCLGFGTMGLAGSWVPTVIGAVVANFGAGLVLPLLITWALGSLPAAHRGIGTGAWMSASFLGQFASPLIILALSQATGSLSNAILAYALACALAVAAIIVFSVFRTLQPKPA